MYRKKSISIINQFHMIENVQKKMKKKGKKTAKYFNYTQLFDRIFIQMWEKYIFFCIR